MDTLPVRAEVPGILISDYWSRPSNTPEPKRLILLLHGFQQSGAYMFKKLAALCPADAWVIAPNAPYPWPMRSETGAYVPGFTWYFYDPAKDEYYIDMRVSLEFLRQLMSSLRQKFGQAIPMTVIGFSQGGYLAPFAAQCLDRVDHVIGIACEWLPEELRETRGAVFPPKFKMDLVHGAQDDVTLPAKARASYEAMAQAGAQGEYCEIPGVGHRISVEVAREVQRFRAGDF